MLLTYGGFEKKLPFLLENLRQNELNQEVNNVKKEIKNIEP